MKTTRSIVRLAAALFVLLCAVAVVGATVLVLNDDIATAQVYATIAVAWALAAIAATTISRRDAR